MNPLPLDRTRRVELIFRHANRTAIPLPPFEVRRASGHSATCRSEILEAVSALEAIAGYRPTPGTKVTPERIGRRLDALNQRIAAADSVDRLVLVQKRMDLEAKLAAANAADVIEVGKGHREHSRVFEFRLRDVLAMMKARKSVYGRSSISPLLTTMPEFERVSPGIYRRADASDRLTLVARRRLGGLSTCRSEILEVVDVLEGRSGLGSSFEFRPRDVIAEFKERKSPYRNSTITMGLTNMPEFERVRHGLYRRAMPHI